MTVIFRVNNVIQSGLFSKWKQVYWNEQLCHIKVTNKQDNELIENNLKLNQISVAFYILLFCLPFSLGILLVETLFFKLKQLECFL